jgi:hypothetical protein
MNSVEDRLNALEDAIFPGIRALEDKAAREYVDHFVKNGVRTEKVLLESENERLRREIEDLKGALSILGQRGIAKFFNDAWKAAGDPPAEDETAYPNAVAFMKSITSEFERLLKQDEAAKKQRTA